MRHAIRVPSFRSPDTAAYRSSFSLLRRDGDLCQQGEPIAFCLVSAEPVGRVAGSKYFEADKEDIFAIVLAPKTGRVSWIPTISKGGWIDVLTSASPIRWREECELGSIECASIETEPPLEPEDGLILALGSRVVEWGDVRGGVLPGWYDEVRAWRFRGDLSSLIVASTCAIRFAVLGEQRVAHQLLLRTSQPIHLSYYSETTLIPSVGCLLEEVSRTSTELAAISEEVRSWMHCLHGEDSTQAIAFIALLMDRLQRGSPLFREQQVLQHDGVRNLPASASIVLSTASEEGIILRHKSLPFTLCLPRVLRVPVTLAKVLDERFNILAPYSTDELRVSYQQLSRILQERGHKLFVANAFVSEPGAQLVRPSWMGNITKALSHRTRSLNNALHRLQEQGFLKVLDVDGAVASVGGFHMPDGVHGDREIESAVREVLVRSLKYPARNL